MAYIPRNTMTATSRPDCFRALRFCALATSASVSIVTDDSFEDQSEEIAGRLRHYLLT